MKFFYILKTTEILKINIFCHLTEVTQDIKKVIERIP